MQTIIPFTTYDKKCKSAETAEKILDSVCSTMKTRVYTFIPVLNLLKFVAVKDNIDICTDGERIYYNPKYVIRQAKRKQLYLVEYTLFHILLHGILGHFEQGTWKDKELAWAVWDIQVYRCMKMIYKSDRLMREIDKDLECDYIEEELYFKGVKNKVLRKRVIINGKNCWYENHSYWNEKAKLFWVEIKRILFGKEDITGDEAEGMLENLLKKEAARNRYGQGSADFENEVELEGKSQTSYQELLAKITKLSEVVHEEQELDKVLYQYGLDLYGDVPLVESEEISEKHCLHTLVIAVDTSGSCTERAELFFRELVAVLDEIKRIGRIEHICYLECDWDITFQEDYYSLEEFVEFGTKHTFHGGGGTSFEPVFWHVDKLVEEGETVDALIYITDGYGDMDGIEEQPPYEVCFLLDVDDDVDAEFLKEDYLTPWVQCFVLKKS